MTENNSEDSIKFAHVREQFEAATEEAKTISSGVTNYMQKTVGMPRMSKMVTMHDTLKGYLLEEWTWFHAFVPEMGVDPFAPEHCEHVDPQHPGTWYALLNVPNKFWCHECAGKYVSETEKIDEHVCDRCKDPNTHQFHDFNFPIGNMIMVGSICKSCVDKTLNK